MLIFMEKLTPFQVFIVQKVAFDYFHVAGFVQVLDESQATHSKVPYGLFLTLYTGRRIKCIIAATIQFFQSFYHERNSPIGLVMAYLAKQYLEVQLNFSNISDIV